MQSFSSLSLITTRFTLLVKITRVGGLVIAVALSASAASAQTHFESVAYNDYNTQTVYQGVTDSVRGGTSRVACETDSSFNASLKVRASVNLTTGLSGAVGFAKCETNSFTAFKAHAEGVAFRAQVDRTDLVYEILITTASAEQGGFEYSGKFKVTRMGESQLIVIPFSAFDAIRRGASFGSGKPFEIGNEDYKIAFQLARGQQVDSIRSNPAPIQFELNIASYVSFYRTAVTPNYANLRTEINPASLKRDFRSDIVALSSDLQKRLGAAEATRVLTAIDSHLAKLFFQSLSVQDLRTAVCEADKTATDFFPALDTSVSGCENLIRSQPVLGLFAEVYATPAVAQRDWLKKTLIALALVAADRQSSILSASNIAIPDIVLVDYFTRIFGPAQFKLTQKTAIISKEIVSYDPLDSHPIVFSGGLEAISNVFFEGRVVLDRTSFGQKLGVYSFPLQIAFILETSGNNQNIFESFYGGKITTNVTDAWRPWAKFLVRRGNTDLRSTRYYKDFLPLR